MLISGKAGSGGRTILEHSQLIECMGIIVLSLAHGSELRCSDVWLQVVKRRKKSGFFSLAGVHVLGWPLLGFCLFVGISRIFRLVCGANHV